MTFQHSLRLEQLPIEKETYLKVEQRLLKMTKFSSCIFILLGLVCMFNAYISSLRYPYTIMALEVMWIICSIIIVGNHFIRQGFWLLWTMYRFQRHEFYIHR